MVVCSAPGKLILFGEHAVVFGEPALSMAVNLRIRTEAEVSSKFSVNDQDLQKQKHSYVYECIENVWKGEPLSLRIDSGIPSAAGMGSSAAVTVSTLGALLRLKGEFDPVLIAKKGFEIEYEVQGSASPIDTTTTTHGSGILVAREARNNLLWVIRKDGKEWYLHECDLPEMKLVVGDTGIRSRTGPLVAKVRSYVEESSFARDVVSEIGQITLQAVEALSDGDFVSVGALMIRNHNLLSVLGVGHPKLDNLVRVASDLSYGAKTTGAGGGGSMIALTDDPLEVAKVIRENGGKAYIVKYEKRGVIVEC